MDNKSAAVILKKGKDQSLQRFHPWVFSGAVAKILGDPENGDLVKVLSSDGTLIGKGHFQRGSIMVRMLVWDDSTPDLGFFKDRISKALSLRASSNPEIKAGSTDCYRLVHGEGDFLPGLIVDIYGKTAVLQTHSAGMYQSRNEIAEAIKEVFQENNETIDAIYSKSTPIGTFKGDDDYLYIRDGYTPVCPIKVKENGCLFWVDWEKGQKTGFFLDQRDNRNLVRKFSSGKTVLNLFCYTGGFSVYALRGGAILCDSVDSSQTAIDACKDNIILNGFIDSGDCICTDAIEYLKNIETGKYSLMIVDPPAFAKHLSAKQNALRAYKKLNAMAIEKVAKGGVVFTFSCSQVVDKNDFALAVFSAAALAKRKVRIIHRLTQPSDHPVDICHPEGEYLKGLVLYVE